MMNTHLWITGFAVYVLPDKRSHSRIRATRREKTLSRPVLATSFIQSIERPADITDLIVKSTVKDALKGRNFSAEFYDALNAEVQELLDDTARRVYANDQKTVQPRDP